jgi:SAM-dependent methyltransferase
MSVLAMLTRLALERVSRHELPRVPEPQLIMEDPDQVSAFTQSVQEDGLLAPIGFYHAVQAMPLMRAGDRVLDLACGPAHQLLQIARLNPQARFVGLDASTAMLRRARSAIEHSAVDNVELVSGDMLSLDGFAGASVDCVLCTMALHHLPDQAALHALVREVRRVLKPGGGLYVADFGRLKRVATQQYFAQDRIECQSARFTQDYFQSMQAAFSVAELTRAFSVFWPGLSPWRTALAPFMLIFRSGEQRRLDASSCARVREHYRRMSAGQRRDFQNFARWFRAGGLGLPCAPD